MPAEDRLLFCLKSRGPQTTAALARHLKLTEPGVRKQLAALLEETLVSFEDESGSVGRPRRIWRLTQKAESRFPDSHAFLTVEMLNALRELHGEDGLDRLISRREAQTLARYGGALRALPALKDKVARLSKLRSEEGYLSDWRKLPDGSYLLVENHCPICAAARTCQGFCRSELAVFREALGPAVSVERTEHILAGARRCAYRIAAANG